MADTPFPGFLYLFFPIQTKHHQRKDLNSAAENRKVEQYIRYDKLRRHYEGMITMV